MPQAQQPTTTTTTITTITTTDIGEEVIRENPLVMQQQAFTDRMTFLLLSETSIGTRLKSLNTASQTQFTTIIPHKVYTMSV